MCVINKHYNQKGVSSGHIAPCVRILTVTLNNALDCHANGLVYRTVSGGLTGYQTIMLMD